MTRVVADVEAALVSLLGPDAGTRVPNPRPAEWTRVTRAGGTRLNIVQSRPRILVECWGPSSVAAFGRIQECYRRLAACEGSAVGGVFVSEVVLDDPVNFPDPAYPKEARYQLVAQLTTSLQEA